MEPWRLDPIGSGRLAWLYLITRPQYWPEQSAGADDAGYWFTEETQPLVDDEFGACFRYLCVQTGDKDSIILREAFAQASAVRAEFDASLPPC